MFASVPSCTCTTATPWDSRECGDSIKHLPRSLSSCFSCICWSSRVNYAFNKGHSARWLCLLARLRWESSTETTCLTPLTPPPIDGTNHRGWWGVWVHLERASAATALMWVSTQYQLNGKPWVRAHSPRHLSHLPNLCVKPPFFGSLSRFFPFCSKSIVCMCVCAHHPQTSTREKPLVDNWKCA